MAARVVFQLAALSALFASAVEALEFTKPGFNQVASSGYPYFSVGDEVDVEWTTQFDETTLVVFQRVSNGNVFYDTLAGKRAIHLGCPLTHAILEYLMQRRR